MKYYENLQAYQQNGKGNMGIGYVFAKEQKNKRAKRVWVSTLYGDEWFWDWSSDLVRE